ncbi:MFS transporter [Pseudolysinimonas yzui]|uniref:MFS transporter n=1 Tax=Pseudolysinimonas yzui TaxID=2708254 RepID=A0A8J3GR78_9MICO|nr:MFS transporter [Pseudolysinimonas yzui]GHF19987.1 MFS transporter [Pseudolysinimonas yzui]
MSASHDDRFPLFRLLVLAGAIFVSVSSEFLPTGLLPDIAADLDVSESRVGLLITVFAFTVVVSAAPLTVLTRRFSRKRLLVLLLGVFALSNVLAAIAPNYETLAASRVLGGLAHGLFWAVAGPYVSLLVRPTQLARAVSVTTAGGALAFILGVPFTAAIGHAVGWRWAFVAMAALVVIFAILTVVSLPALDHRVPKRKVVTTDTGSIIAVKRDRSIIAVGIVAVTVLLVATGHNLFYTYIAPWVIQVAGVADDNVSLLLLFFGLAGALGLLAAGVFGDRHPRRTLNLMLVALVVSIVLTGLFARGLVPAILVMMLWSASFGGLPALFQTRALHAAAPRSRDLTGAIVTTAFNSAIGLGALLGGIVLDELGLAVVPYVAAAVVAGGAVWVLVTDRMRLAAHATEAIH